MYGIGGDDRGDLLALEPDLVGGEHRLGVARHRGHPREVVLGEQLAGDDRDHAVDRRRCRRVDAADASVRHRRPQDRHVQHAGQRVVVEVVALTLVKRSSSWRLTEWPMPPISGVVVGFGCGGGHVTRSASIRSSACSSSMTSVVSAAARIALTMFM